MGIDHNRNDEVNDDDNGGENVVDRKHEILKSVENIQLTRWSKYDYPSVLTSLSVTDLPQCNVFTDIIKEMRER